MVADKLIRGLIKNRLIVLFLAVVVAAIGVFSYYIIPKQENPSTSVAAAILTTVYPGASPSEIESNVTNILEDEVSAIPEVDYYTSVSMNNVSVIVVMFKQDKTIDDVETNLRQTVEDAASLLPEGAHATEINARVSDENQFLISLSSENYTSLQLEQYANEVKDIITAVDGIETVVIDGIKPTQMVIETDTEKMKNNGIAIETIVGIIEAYNTVIPSGSIEDETGTINVITPTVFEDIEDIENTIIGVNQSTGAPLLLKDVALVYAERVDEYHYMQDGDEAVMISGTIYSDQNAVIVGQDLRKALDDAKEKLPSDLIFHEIMYAPQDIDDSVNEFIMNFLQSILLIVIVVMIGVHLRNGIIVSIAIPLSILMTFIVMNFLSVEFHFISIAALIVSLGILVDNAIVVSEAIQHNLNKNKEKVTAIIDGVKETAIPVLASTLTTIVTFSIIYFVPGVVGKVAGEIPTVVIISLLASYLVAMLVTPVLAFYFFKPEKTKIKVRKNYIRMGFERLLKLGIRHKITTVFISFLTLGIAALLALQLGIKFFPVSDKPVIYLNFETDNVSLDSSSEISEEINEILNEEDYIKNYAYAIGKGLPNFFLTVPTITQAPNVGQYMIEIEEEKIPELGGTENIARELQDKFNNEVEDAKISVKCLEYSMPSEAKINFLVSGNDMEELVKIADEMVAELQKIEGTSYVRNTAVSELPQLNVVIDEEKATSYGIQKFDITRQINTALMNINSGFYTHENENVDLVIRSDIMSEEDLMELLIVNNTGGVSVPLKQVASIETTYSVPMIEHYNGQKYISVLSDVLPGHSSVSIQSEIYDNFISKIDSDVTVIEQGEVSKMSDLVVSLAYSASAAVLLIYVILLLQFKNFKRPFIILISIPLSFIGCGFGLWLFNMDIQATALLGLVSLFGIVVNNSILLIEEIKRETDNGIEVEEACINAVSIRFRPIMLSSITTCIGLVPLILSGDPMTSPMASVLLFGLLFSTLLTIVVIPTIYSFSKNKKKKAKRLSL